MKKTLLAMAITGASVVGTINVANAADGTINFNGVILDQTCTVSPNTQTQTVSLGQIANTSFGGTAGAKSSPTAFQINLSSCPAGLASAAVKFDGTSDTNNSNLLQVTQGTGAATGVGIEISDANGVIPLHTASADYPLANGSAQLQFIARYVSTSATVGNGQANGVSQFTLNYK
ncbi:fimbrial protein [Dryocola clanedunensis]